jgi:hypothetical protein
VGRTRRGRRARHRTATAHSWTVTGAYRGGG